jgi:hypothetical protein
MGAWVLIPCLVTLRSEFNQIAPDRDKGADGAIGDTNHTSSSDHTPDEDSRVLKDHDGDRKNEVHALDVDSDGKWPGTGTQKERFHRINMRILAWEKEKWKNEKDKCRLNYMIWDRKIYDKDNDFEPRPYTGSDPHTNHAHYSGRYETECESDTRPWGVVDLFEVKEEEAMAFKDELVPLTSSAGKELFDPDKPAGTSYNAHLLLQLAAIWSKRASDKLDKLTELVNTLKTDLDAVRADNATMKSQLDAITADPSTSTGTSHPIVRAVNFAETN